MGRMNVTRGVAAAVIVAGGALLAGEPAHAAPRDLYACSMAGWMAAISDAGAVCGGSGNPTVVAHCSGGSLVIEQIIC